MKTINALRIENLTLPEEMAYYNFVVTTVAANSIVSNKFAQSFAIFKAAYDYQDELYMRHDRKALTQAVQDCEAMRDKWLRKLRNNVREVLDFGSGEKLAAAQLLSTVIDEYGGAKIPDMKVEAETGVLLNLYKDLQTKYPDEVELLGMTAVVAGAKQANDAFIEAQNARLQSDADFGRGKLEAARPITAKKYRYFIDSVNLGVEVDDDGELAPFVEFMNAKIDEMRRLSGQGSSISGSTGAAGSTTGGTGGEVAAIMKNATFKFIGGRTEIIPVEVGTVLIPPTNTEGYKWKPTVPELMPKTNKNFSEVPIDDREVTLTFHFLEHNDETLRGIVGSALTAPLNTDGCHWEPTVPPTFPEEDMTFNEVLDEPAGGGNYSIAKFIFQSGESEEIRQLVGSVLHAPQNTEGCRWIPEVPATMPAVNTTYNEVGENEKLYTIAWYDKSTPVAWYELPEGAAIPEAPEPPAGCRWAQTFTVMPARDVDIVAVAL